MTLATVLFTDSLAAAPRFAAAFDETGYRRLPDDWLIAVTDVVRSRDAIASGRYKAVNMAGVAAISATMNALATHSIPYSFAGDGAALAIAPQEEVVLREVLARTVTMAAEELGLELRASIVPLSRIRADGFDVRVEAVRISDAVVNFAFAGGGVSHAERLMKAGEFRVAPAPAGARPDLSGLSCRWTPVSSEGHAIVSVIVEQGSGASPGQFAGTLRRILAMVGQDGDARGPVPESGPRVAWPVQGTELEARATRGRHSLPMARLRLQMQTLLAWVLFATGWKLGRFDPVHYKRVTALNTDYRKLQDGLRMTLSLLPEETKRLEAFLEDLRLRKLVRYGICVQDEAVLTCFVPSVMEDDHFHFLDGAGGGYAAAAAAIRD